ncbi:MAG: acyl-[acyl-carrier-protein]--UDP-N-acetylglucosamine O-acyltransferase [Candidatus Omnitrophota bacterium]|nr:MAG: acyl-[acyl-carrier-protein]--UDP-N-acetylglucosamine O-acyltransferase [Candidatus Omnitrophota bacterium]
MAESIKIHPTAIIHPKAELAQGVEIGAYSTIGKNVKINCNTKIGSFCVIDGDTQIGKRCNIFTGAVIGTAPQDLKYKGEATKVHIGDDNQVREYVTVNRGTIEKGVTSIGNKNLLMAYSHIAHDCEIQDGIVIANAGTCAGHVKVESKAIIGGMVAIHQFVCIGSMAIIGGCSKVVQDVPPYSMVDGHPVRVYGANIVGLKRADIPEENINNLKKTFVILFRKKLSISNALEKVADEIPVDPFVLNLINFIKDSKRGICRGK